MDPKYEEAVKANECAHPEKYVSMKKSTYSCLRSVAFPNCPTAN
jgi:hypothetical protein